MESKEDLKWYEKLGIGSLILAALVFMVSAPYSIHQAGLRDQARRDSAKAQCRTLDARLGDTLEIKEGPYRGIPMMAIKFGEETITVVPLIDLPISTLSDMQLRLECNDFKIVKRGWNK